MAGGFFNSLLGIRAKLTYAGGVCGRWGIDHNEHEQFIRGRYEGS